MALIPGTRLGVHDIVLQVLPKGFVRIRFFGFLAHRRRAQDLPRCRRALEAGPGQPLAPPTIEQATPSASWPCPRCGGMMMLIERLTVRQIRGRALAEEIFLDTSWATPSFYALDLLVRTGHPDGGVLARPHTEETDHVVFGAASNDGHPEHPLHHRRREARPAVRSTVPRSSDSNAITRPRPPQTPAASFKRLYPLSGPNGLAECSVRPIFSGRR